MTRTPLSMKNPSLGRERSGKREERLGLVPGILSQVWCFIGSNCMYQLPGCQTQKKTRDGDGKIPQHPWSKDRTDVGVEGNAKCGTRGIEGPGERQNTFLDCLTGTT